MTLQRGDFIGREEQTELIKKKILELMPEHATFAVVCSKVGITTRTLRNWRHKDEEFNEAMLEAIEQRNAKLEEVLFDWAMNGKVRRHFNKDGDLVTEVHEPCDKLLITALAANMPDKYSQRIQPVGTDGQPAPLLLLPMTIDHSEWQKHAVAQQEASAANEALMLEQLGEKRRETEDAEIARSEH